MTQKPTHDQNKKEYTRTLPKIENKNLSPPPPPSKNKILSLGVHAASPHWLA